MLRGTHWHCCSTVKVCRHTIHFPRALSVKSLLQGQVKELDDLAQQFVAAAAKKRKDLLEKAKAAADAVDTSASPDTSSYVEYYIKTMQRVLDKGDAYLEQVR